MRIVGGHLSGRRIRVPTGAGVRPTSDRVREAVASVLTSRDALVGATVLELFAGSGAFAFEAISRGAVHTCLVDANRDSLRVIRQNADALDVTDMVQIVNADLSRSPQIVVKSLRAAASEPFTLVFADPPYDHMSWFAPVIAAIADAGLLATNAWVVLEHRTGAEWTPTPPFALESQYRYGDTAVTLAAYRSPEGTT